jgi:hypothetical protein
MLGKKMVKPLQEKQEDVPHKRAQLYSFDPACLATLNDSPEDEL